MTSHSDFMQNCHRFFNDMGFERDEIMPLIRQLQTDSDHIDTSGESYTTPALELLRRYIAAHWSTFDPNEPHACTPKKEGMEWLKKESADYQKVSKTMVEAIDLIVRHPSAKTRMNNPKKSG